ncbi:adenosylmethionine decarboxylase [Methyloversatilis discipulorum]|uniref:adenosylmethionine decarboxylase n=1 Tax=Methyloversatilis discipulorum TaxID=1119528 RepID=UPI001A53E141|nr:adenosylmethionine decarboxylase [Methyloversatilis discipulorum]MBL8469703.1 adenosylmethionine decarboxylase [Methyloversatilis discipulorum]
MSVPPIGLHVLLDLHQVEPGVLADLGRIEAVLDEAARAAGAHVLGGHFHPFGPGLGVTGVLLLAESHISIHTWPEHGYAAVDVFMCGKAEAMTAARLIGERLQALRVEVREQARGTEIGTELNG